MSKEYSSPNDDISVRSAPPGDKRKVADMLSGLPKDVRRRWLIVGGVVVAAIAMASSWMSAANPPVKREQVKREVTVETTPRGLNDQKDWRSQTGADIKSLQQQLAGSDQAQKELLARLEAMHKEMVELKKGQGTSRNSTTSSAPKPQANIDFTLPPPPEAPKSIQPAQPVVSASANTPILAPITPAPVVKRAPARSFIPQSSAPQDDEAARLAAAQELELNKKAGYLPAASFGAATMLSGVDALTGDSAQANPQPIVIRLDESAVLPNAAKYGVKGCHVLASVWGNMSAERVYGRLATLTCVDANHNLVLSEEVEGMLVDSDGKNGIRGDVQDRQGAKLGRALLAGFAEGMATAFGYAQTTVSTTALGTTSAVMGGNSFRSAGYAGAEAAAKQLSDFYIKQAEATLPVIAVDAGRKISVVFTKSVSLKFETTATYKNKPARTLKVIKE